MNSCCVLPCLILAVVLYYDPTNAQLPPRLNIPGAVLVSQPKPAQFRQQRIQQQIDNSAPRLRRPPPAINVAPSPIRPVVEEVEEQSPQGNFDDELSRLGLSALQNAVRQSSSDEDEEPETERPIQFRPERPVPVLRTDIRDGPRDPPPPPPPLRSGQLFRDAVPQKPFRQENNFINRPIPREEAPRPIARQSIARQNIAPQPVRQPVRSHPPRQPVQQLIDDDNSNRRKKPVVQILRKYRTDNEDGSITWGFENEDGTFKEETLGTDCVTRGRYGYIDPDGVKREYKYESGNKCDHREEEEPEQLLEQRQPGPHPRKPQPQLRPLPVQYHQ